MFPKISAIEIHDPTFETEETESEKFISAASRQSQKAQANLNWNTQMLAAIEIASNVNPYESNLPEGSIIPAVNAMGWRNGVRNCDIRPRLLDKATGEQRLIDSGSMISVTKKQPQDQLDTTMRLVAVNGSKIDSYGTREVVIKIGRKTYRIEAVICDVKQDILGMDFLDKYKLGFEWDNFDQSELSIVDKKANISQALEIVTVPTDLQRVHYLSSSADATESKQLQSDRDNNRVAFEVACMKEIGQEKSKSKSIEEQLSVHDPYYIELIKKYPQLLNPNFVKGQPVHGVWHKIETGNHPPFKGKRRPIIADSITAEKGKKAWDQMIQDGIVERVKAGTKLDWLSPLHIANKAGGGARPCTDFRQLNKATVCDAYALPLFRDFTSQIGGCQYFSVIDLKSAFFNVPI